MKKLIISVLTALILVAVMAAPAIAADTQTTQASASVSEYFSISLSGGITFSSLNPGDTDVAADSSPAVVITVEPETNVNVDIGIMGDNTDGITIDNWEYSTDDDATLYPLTAAYVLTYDDEGVGTCNFYHWITVPGATGSGTYHADVHYKAVKTGDPLN
jgi:hypothetical protein